MNSKDEAINRDYVDFIVKMRIFFDELKKFADLASKILIIVENPICKNQIDSFYEITNDLDSKETKVIAKDIKNHEKCKNCLRLIYNQYYFFFHFYY